MGTRFFCSCHWTLFMFWHFKLEVCVPELVLNETRQDETGHHFLNWRYWEKTTFFWSRCTRKSGKIREINCAKAKIMQDERKRDCDNPKTFWPKLDKNLKPPECKAEMVTFRPCHSPIASVTQSYSLTITII